MAIKQSMIYLNQRFALTALIALALGLSVEAEQTDGAQWVTAWSTSQQALGTTVVTDATVRLVARVTATGASVRIRLDNAYGTRPLVMAAATVGVPMRGAVLDPGSIQIVYFEGLSDVRIPAGESVTSDPVVMPVIAQQDLAISLHIPERDVRPSQHNGARVTSYITNDRNAMETIQPTTPLKPSSRQ